MRPQQAPGAVFRMATNLVVKQTVRIRNSFEESPLLFFRKLLDKLDGIITVQLVDDLNQLVGIEFVDQIFTNSLIEMNKDFGFEIVA